MRQRIASWVFFFLLAVSLCLGGVLRSARADEKPAADYVLGPDDVIEITVQNHSDLNKMLTILPDGKITFPEVGELKAAGKTPKALAAEIQAELEKARNNVVVAVLVKEIHSRRARILGAVRAPSAYDLRPNWRIVDLVAVAGGLSVKPGRVSGRIIRGGTKVIPLDVAQAIAKPNSAANALLEPDDLVLLDELEPIRSQVHVMGQVGKPGAYEMDADMTVLSLLSQAGSPTERAALSKAYVLRGATEIPLNLRPLLAEGKADAAVTRFRFVPGDVLFLPEIQTRYAVMGQVNRPGYFTLPEKGQVTALQALNLAGGQLPDGDISKAGIIRTVEGKPRVLTMDITAILKKGALSADLALEAEDILYVPTRRRSFDWQSVLGPLSILSFLGLRL